MPIIKSVKVEKEQIRISIKKKIVEEVRQYCEWAGVNKADEFFEQAAEHILSRDKEWIIHIVEKAKNLNL